MSDGPASVNASRSWLPRGWLFALLGLLLLATLSTTAPLARAGSPNYCNFGGNETHVWCGGDFTTSSWSNGWTTTYANQAACYSANSNSYSDSVSGGGLYAKASTRADESSSCSTNVGEIYLNIGTHGGQFTAWKAGSATYTVVTNFTFNDEFSIGTYCQVSGSPYTTAQIQAATAMYDQTTGHGVGWSSNGDFSNTTINGWCNQSSAPVENGGGKQASFTTSVSIAYGDVLLPRGSVDAEVYVSMPGVSPYYSAHAYSTLDFDNDGYGYITINSIWVH
ncbi:MAG: hypothetical protein KGJ23_13935 [Euryarchaeota archaeon]|nr:hypothetical protein [Euryarchaeota archaeon]MDE1837698.1 hypothetical protein [Euryarchaeota archaeon]MDE1881743.1 hypothetical protein [Euryarchaeota archaeon]MDE2045972.1 hypothetical protein [Thermoplasmata archaeon]